MPKAQPWPWFPARTKDEYYARLRRATAALKARQLWRADMRPLNLYDREYLVIEHRRGY